VIRTRDANVNPLSPPRVHPLASSTTSRAPKCHQRFGMPSSAAFLPQQSRPARSWRRATSHQSLATQFAYSCPQRSRDHPPHTRIVASPNSINLVLYHGCDAAPGHPKRATPPRPPGGAAHVAVVQHQNTRHRHENASSPASSAIASGLFHPTRASPAARRPRCLVDPRPAESTLHPVQPPRRPAPVASGLDVRLRPSARCTRVPAPGTSPRPSGQVAKSSRDHSLKIQIP
jgi:hypothetical protein